MARKGLAEENQYDLIIISSFLSNQHLRDPKRFTWTEIWKYANGRGIGSQQTFSKRLKDLQQADYVLREGKYYSLNPILNWFGEFYTRDFAKQGVLRKRVPPRHLLFGGDLSKPFGEAVLTDANFRGLVQLIFNNQLVALTTTLHSVVWKDEHADAVKLAYAFMKIHVEPLLMTLIEAVWKNREKARIFSLVGANIQLVSAGLGGTRTLAERGR